MRLFVALEIPSDVRENLAAFLEDLRGWCEPLGDNRVRGVRPENLHVTLKFIGEVAAARLNAIRNALSAVHALAPLELRFRGLGFFPDAKHPTTLWTGLEAPAKLIELAGDIDRALETQGIPREKHAFVPHLTLARFATPVLQEKLRAAIQKNAAREFGSFQAREFHLIESKLKPAGPEYTSFATFPLTPETKH